MDKRALSPDTHTAGEVAQLLKLEPLDQEGGFFRRTAESGLVLPDAGRRVWSMIYLLVTPEEFSALHLLKSDEAWYFRAGDALEALRLRPDGGGAWVRLGLNRSAGEQPQDIVPAHTWQGARLAPGGRWALVSCVVAPGFVWEDFKPGDRATLTAAYPAFADGVRALTRAQPPRGQR